MARFWAAAMADGGGNSVRQAVTQLRNSEMHFSQALKEAISGVPMRAPSGAPTQTLVWYGRGLLAEDRGETAAAVEAYQNAIGLDPRFDAARGRLAEALAVNRARATPLAQMAALASRELPGPLTGLQEVRRLVPSGIGGRDAVAEALGVEGVGREVILEIVVQPAEL